MNTAIDEFGRWEGGRKARHNRAIVRNFYLLFALQTFLLVRLMKKKVAIINR